MNKHIHKLLPIIIVAVLAGTAGFLGGMQYQKTKAGTNPQRGNFQGTRNGGSRLGTNGGTFTNGQILSMDSKSITLELQNSGSKIIFFSPSTEIGKFVTGTPADLAAGDTIIATGTQNSDGSITATSIQIRPAQTKTAQ